jgi:hypothetical protein
LDVKTAKEVMLRIATLKGTEFNAENVKKIIEEIEARQKSLKPPEAFPNRTNTRFWEDSKPSLLASGHRRAAVQG